MGVSYQKDVGNVLVQRLFVFFFFLFCFCFLLDFLGVLDKGMLVIKSD